jgi:hypothetical protein
MRNHDATARRWYDLRLKWKSNDSRHKCRRWLQAFANLMITVFTPSFADENNTNAQNLTVKEVVARMDPCRFRVVMLGGGAADPRIAARPNTRILRWEKRGNTARILWHMLRHIPDVYFFPR